MKDTIEPADQKTDEQQQNGQLGFVSGDRLLEILFPDESSRPCLKSLERAVKRKIVPSVRLGRLRFYQVEAVRSALIGKSGFRGGSR